VRQRAVRAARDDRRERRILGAALAHLALEIERHLPLGAAREAARAEVLVDVVGQVGRLADGAQLALLLHRAQVLHETAGGHQLDALRRQLLEPLVLTHAHVLVLEPHPPGQALGRIGQQVLLAAQPLEVRHLLLGALHVAEVGKEEAVVRRDYADRVRAGEAAQVAHVHEVREEQRVQLALGEPLHQLVRACGAHSANTPFSISSASR